MFSTLFEGKKRVCFYADDFEMCKIDGHYFILDGWNGEVYLNCNEAIEPTETEEKIVFFDLDRTQNYVIKPIYREPDEYGDCEVEDYVITF